MIKLISIVMVLFISSNVFSQDDIKPCGQLPYVNPTVKPICLNDIQKVLSDSLPVFFKEKAKYESTFKLLIDCNGRVDMVIYKNGNFTTEQQKYFLLKLNELRDWSAGKIEKKDISTTVYFTIDIDNRLLKYKQF